jgi:ArsR family transcriptional regulator, arsenate/arsenite/antimonite-responsive transcriptional repressor
MLEETRRRTAGLVPSPARIRSTISAIAAPPEELREVALMHKALADPTRLRLVQRLASGPGTVSQLMAHVDLSQPLVSWHLRRLRNAGLVETRRRGREVVCSLSREAVARFHERQRALLGMAGTAGG